MQITLASATSWEIQKTLEHISDWNKLRNIEINHIVTGIGLIESTYTLTKYLQKNKPDLFIQAGIAGCFDNKIPLGSTFFVKEDTIADIGVYENNQWRDATYLGFIKEDQQPWKNGLLINPSYIPEYLNIPIANGISVNEISTDSSFIQAMINHYNPLIESMEGAAFHYSCLQENIPFIQLRSISNYVGERDKSKWHLKESIEHLNFKLIQFINHIIKNIS